MKKTRLYRVHFGANQAMVEASSKAEARRWALAEFGRVNGPYDVDRPTGADLAWVKAMGGKINEA